MKIKTWQSVLITISVVFFFVGISIYQFDIVKSTPGYYAIITNDAEGTRVIDGDIDAQFFVSRGQKYVLVKKTGEYQFEVNVRFTDGNAGKLKGCFTYRLPEYHKFKDFRLYFNNNRGEKEFLNYSFQERLQQGAAMLFATTTSDFNNISKKDLIDTAIEQIQNGTYEYEDSAVVYKEKGERILTKFPLRIKLDSRGNKIHREDEVKKLGINISNVKIDEITVL